MPKIVDHKQMRDRLAAIACRLIATNGLENSSMRALAKAANCTTGLITHYFPYKNALLIASIDYVAKNQLFRIERSALSTPGDIVKIFATNLPVNEDERIAMRVWLALWSLSTMNIELSAVQRRVHRAYLALYAQILQDAGVVRDRTEALAQAERILAVVNGLSIQALQQPNKWPKKRLINEFKDILQRLLVLDFPVSIANLKEA